MVWLPIRRRKISPDHPLSFHHGSSSQWRHMRIKLLNYYITFVSGKVQDRVYTGLKKERWWLIWAMQYVWVGFPMFDIYLLGPKIHYIENGRSFCRVSKTLDENLSKLRPHSKSDFAWPGRPTKFPTKAGCDVRIWQKGNIWISQYELIHISKLLISRKNNPKLRKE